MLGSIFQSVLGGLKGLGGGFKEGIGQSLGMDWTKVPKSSMSPEFIKNVTMRGAGGAYNLPTTPTPSIWQKIGKSLGERAMSGQASSPSSPSLPDVDTSTRVSQSSGYQGRKKKSQMETLLEQLARR